MHASWCCDDPPPRPRTPSSYHHTTMTLYHATSHQSNSELRSPQERAKYAMLGGSEVVVRFSIASCDLWCTHNGAMKIRRRATVSSEPICHSMTFNSSFNGDFELRLPQECVKYAMLGGSEVAVGTSIASYAPMKHASWCCGDPPPRPRTLRTIHATP